MNNNKNEKKYGICEECATIIKVPMKTKPVFGNAEVLGYCRLCGAATLFAARVTKKILLNKNIRIPTLKELSDNDGVFEIEKYRINKKFLAKEVI